MSKNLIIGTKTYEDVSTVNFNTTDDSIAVFKDVDEMTSGSFNLPTEMALAGTNNTDADMTLNAFFLENDVIVGSGEIIIFKVEGETAPTTTNYTLRTALFAFDTQRNDAQVCVATGMTSQVAPSTITGYESGVGSFSTAYATRNNTTGVFNVHASYTSTCIPAGASVYYARYPISWATGLMHE